MSYGFESFVEESRRLLMRKKIEGIKSLQKLNGYLSGKYLSEFPKIASMAIDMNSEIYVIAMISAVQNKEIQDSDYNYLLKKLDEMMKKIYEILSPSQLLISEEKSYMKNAPHYVGMTVGKNFGKLVLTKCYFYSNRYQNDLDNQGLMIMRTGWVVSGFVGSCKQHFMIPEKYDNLPIIGILPSAYTCIDEYRDENSQHNKDDYKYIMNISVIFSSSQMRVIFPPRIYNNRYKVVVDYHTYDDYLNKVLDGRDGSRYSSVTMYDAAIMSFDPTNNYLKNLQKLIAKAGSKNHAYALIDFYTIGAVQLVPDSHSKYGSREEKWRKYFSLAGASRQTYHEAVSHPSFFLDTFIDGEYLKKGITNSFEALGVGKYMYTTKSVDSSSVFKGYNAVVGFVYRELNKPTYLYFNTIKGSDVIIKVEDRKFQ